MTKIRTALYYASIGLPVLPLHSVRDGVCTCKEGKDCKRPGKHPRTKHGVNDATTNRKLVKKFWKAWPDANIGVATGEVSGILVIDVDPRNGGKKSLKAAEKKLGALPVTVKAITGGHGSHIIYVYPDSPVRSDTAGKLLGPGLDVLSDGSYFVAPPSVGIERAYCWVKNHSPHKMKPAALPNAWQARLTRSDIGAPTTITADIIPEGARNSTLTSLAGTMRRFGATPEAIKAALLEQNQKAVPPLSEAEVERIANSVSSYAPGAAMAMGDTALAILGMVLNKHFGAGRHLMIEQGRFWHYETTHWREVPENWVLKQILEVITEVTREGIVQTKTASSTMLKQCRELVRAKLAVKDDLLSCFTDPQPIINTLSGELWVQDDGSVDLRPHSPESYLRGRLDIGYDPAANCPIYDRTLEGIFSKAADATGMIRHWHELVGYVILQIRNIPLIVIGLGRGDNGKTKLVATLTKLLGDAMVCAQPIGNFASNRFAMASLFGKLMLVDDDVAQGVRLPDGFLKMISEEKLVTAEEKFKPAFNFKVRTVPFLLCNNPPTLADLSHGIRRRLMVIPFDKTFKGEEKDPTLFPKIWASEMPGVLNRALEGLTRLRQRGRFEYPVDISWANRKFLRLANPLMAFISECCEKGKGSDYIYLNKFYERYEAWCNESGVTKKQQRNKLGENLEHLGYALGKGNDGRKVIGLKWK